MIDCSFLLLCSMEFKIPELPTSIRQQIDWSSERAVHILSIVGPTPCKQQLDLIFKYRPVSIFDPTAVNHYTVLFDVEIVPMNCAAYVSHKTPDGQYVRANLHSIAVRQGLKHNCSNSVVRSRDGSLHLLETLLAILPFPTTPHAQLSAKLSQLVKACFMNPGYLRTIEPIGPEPDTTCIVTTPLEQSDELYSAKPA
ncbi:hypothetical protein PRIPAC_92826 [Pristionchus pacificus]|uniref:Uncharacterized protein n=1 Tax=Pristionchus pacificus TaxID=54126 RepID=A0A2A6CDK3_PRIPA|nr:hypothetical protein PRIPAC_92826 [Pristionchus pacificus]|eukprot:PDM76189.1 hypothetical protein PRIPAC_39793 [Pristionchus pacificus]